MEDAARADTIPPPPPGRYKRGYHRNSAETRERMLSAHVLLGAPDPVLPSSFSMEDYVKVRDQRETSSCVPHAGEQAIRVRLNVEGHTTPSFFSVLYPYAWARMLARTSKAEKIVDEGCIPSCYVAALGKTGCPTEDEWPFDDDHIARINEEPSFDVEEDAGDFKVTGDYLIKTDGADRIEQMVHALASGYPFIYGTDVTQAFEDYDGRSVIDRLKDASIGGHMLMCCGYEKLSSGVYVFRNVNSWGTSWGDRGLFRTSEEFMTDPRLGDITVITLAPKDPKALNKKAG